MARMLSTFEGNKLKADVLGKLGDQLSDMDWLVELISERLSPEDVFSHKELSIWAENNGFVSESEE